MPEGPEIRRAADTLEAAIKGEPLTEAWFAFPQLQPYQTQLIGQRVTHIATRGKALLTHFSGGLTLYSHNQLYGVWRVVDAGVEPQSNRVLRVRLQTASKAILLYSASDIDILTAEQVANHPFLQRVGPDVLDMHDVNRGAGESAAAVGQIPQSSVFRPAAGSGFSCRARKLSAGGNSLAGGIKR